MAEPAHGVDVVVCVAGDEEDLDADEVVTALQAELKVEKAAAIEAEDYHSAKRINRELQLLLARRVENTNCVPGQVQGSAHVSPEASALPACKRRSYRLASADNGLKSADATHANKGASQQAVVPRHEMPPDDPSWMKLQAMNRLQAQIGGTTERQTEPVGVAVGVADAFLEGLNNRIPT